MRGGRCQGKNSSRSRENRPHRIPWHLHHFVFALFGACPRYWSEKVRSAPALALALSRISALGRCQEAGKQKRGEVRDGDTKTPVFGAAAVEGQERSQNIGDGGLLLQRSQELVGGGGGEGPRQ